MPLDEPKQFSNALILQGDWEGGLSNVALDLMSAGKRVTKAVFHAGDWIYKWKRIPTIDFDAPIDSFEFWLRNYINNHEIDCLILYNQYRPYNAIAWDIAAELDLECIVFELGLLRPDYCSIYTRELNHFAYLANRWANVKKLDLGTDLPRGESAFRLGQMSTPKKMTQFATFYFFSRIVAKMLRRYTHYQDQRSLSFRHHLMAGVRSLLRFQGREKQQRFDRIFSSKWSGKYYFVPLQVHIDSQITRRSNFKSIGEFMDRVVTSFLKNAPSDTKLVFKVHPMDRGYKDYHQKVESYKALPGAKHRIFYLDRVHLPTALDNAKACITINSSVGLSALIHGCPTITLGEAAYDLDGLTYRGSLNDFWMKHGRVNMENTNKFVDLLKHTSQARGTLYQRLYACPGRCKIQWPYEFRSVFSSQQCDTHPLLTLASDKGTHEPSLPTINSSLAKTI